MKSKTTTLGPFVRLGRGLEYTLVIQRGKGRNAEFIAGVHFAGKPTRRELRQWRDAIQRGIEPNRENDMSDVPLNPRTTPLGVLLVAGLPTAQAIEAVGAIDTPAVIEMAIRAEGRCMARGAVLAALKARLL